MIEKWIGMVLFLFVVEIRCKVLGQRPEELLLSSDLWPGDNASTSLGRV